MERLAGLSWRKSTYSGSNGGGCIEVGRHTRQVLVRDTQDRTGPALGVEPRRLAPVHRPGSTLVGLGSVLLAARVRHQERRRVNAIRSRMRG